VETVRPYSYPLALRFPTADPTPPRRKHGTFRPRLTQLVASNPATTVRDTTRKAFTLYSSSLPSSSPPSSIYLPALKILSTLKGIGPATASLLLAVYDPERVPFFADELYWWVCCGGEWGRRIAYGVGEYRALWEGVRGVRWRLGVGAVELERGAWVLGREGREGRGGKGGGGGERVGGKNGGVDEGRGKRKREREREREVVEEVGVDGEPRTEDDNGTEPDAGHVSTPSPNRHDRTTPSTTIQRNRSISPPTTRRLDKPTDSSSKSETTTARPLRRSKRMKRS